MIIASLSDSTLALSLRSAAPFVRHWIPAAPIYVTVCVCVPTPIREWTVLAELDPTDFGRHQNIEVDSLAAS